MQKAGQEGAEGGGGGVDKWAEEHHVLGEAGAPHHVADRMRLERRNHENAQADDGDQRGCGRAAEERANELHTATVRGDLQLLRNCVKDVPVSDFSHLDTSLWIFQERRLI